MKKFDQSGKIETRIYQCATRRSEIAMTSCPYDPREMKYGEIAGSKNIDALIYYCFKYLCEEDERKFVKDFREQPPDSDQIMHTFRELILGAYLSSNGLVVRHHYAVDSKTPDWCILDDNSAIVGIVELVNFHVDKATESEFEVQLEAGLPIAWAWPDANKNKDNLDRLYDRIWDKAQVYRALIKRLQVPYIVAVFGEFRAGVSLEEVEHCLLDEDTGLFDKYPEMSGVLYFQDVREGFLFYYQPNPHALRTVDLPDGLFPSRVA
jgi:hypothetical protein